MRDARTSYQTGVLMASAASHPRHLRLVGADDADSMESWRRQRQARQSIIRENQLSNAWSRLLRKFLRQE